MAATLEPEQAAAVKDLLTICAEVLAAVANQPHWQELRQCVALAVLSTIGTSAVSSCPAFSAVYYKQELAMQTLQTITCDLRVPA